MKETLQDMAGNYDKLRVQLLMDDVRQNRSFVEAGNALQQPDLKRTADILKTNKLNNQLWRLMLVQADYKAAAGSFIGDYEVYFQSIIKKLAKLFYFQERPELTFCSYWMMIMLPPTRDHAFSSLKNMIEQDVMNLTGQDLDEFFPEKMRLRGLDCNKALGFERDELQNAEYARSMESDMTILWASVFGISALLLQWCATGGDATAVGEGARASAGNATNTTVVSPNISLGDEVAKTASKNIRRILYAFPVPTAQQQAEFRKKSCIGWAPKGEGVE